jgi:hypothetical protein
MAKIKVYRWGTEPPEFASYAEGWHFWSTDPFEPGAYHTIWPYLLEDAIPSPDYYLREPTYPYAMQAAQVLAANPEILADICLTCRGFAYGPTTPRFNIIRGRCRLPRGWPPIVQPPRPIPCFVQSVWDPPPPGFG